QRLGLAELLMRDTKIAILDEPTSGLDPQSTTELLELIRGFAQEGRTVLISSHLLDVVQSICSRVALFNKGRIGFVGTVAELADKVADGAFRVDVAAEGIDLAALGASVEGINAVTRLDDGRWQVSAARDVRPELARIIVERDRKSTRLNSSHVKISYAVF